MDEEKLKDEILSYFEDLGFKINPHLRSEENTKDAYRNLHKRKKLERISEHEKFLERNFDFVKDYAINGDEINPEKIDLEIREVESGTEDAKILFWWNLIWWSLPYQQMVGRQMRFLLWDKGHDSPFGILTLQSPPLCMKERDEHLNISAEERDYWVNQSMYAQRVGAIPPYNTLLGGKMVTLSMVSNEVRNTYKDKYEGRETRMEGRILPARLLFLTTTSAFGKSSMYDRLKYEGERIGNLIGYTQGTGTFHLSEGLYEKILKFLEEEGVDTERGYGTGPSRKLHLIETAFRKLDIPNMVYHNIQRAIYLFENVENLKEVISEDEDPKWKDRPFNDLFEFWKERYLLPRADRIDRWRNFEKEEYFDQTQRMIHKSIELFDN